MNSATANCQQLETSHYAKRVDAPNVPLRIASASKLLNVINKNFGTLTFCRRYLDRLGQEKYLLGVSLIFTYLGTLLIFLVEQFGIKRHRRGIPTTSR